MKSLHFGAVKKGKLTLDSPERWLLEISRHEGKRVQVSLDTVKNRRSLSQNAYYWGVVVSLLGEHFGYEPDEMHEALKFKFLRKHEDVLMTVGSTAKMDTKEFGEYLDKVIRWAASEYQVYIPDAGFEL